MDHLPSWRIVVVVGAVWLVLSFVVGVVIGQCMKDPFE
jgi:hypothetical protein